MPTDPLPLTLLKRVDEACDRFEEAWRAGQQPRIEDFLPTEIGPERLQFFRKLLEVEGDVRCANGEKPTLEQYEPRFPEYLESVKVLLALTDSIRSPVAGPGTLPGASRYEILAEVGRGGMGIVY